MTDRHGDEERFSRRAKALLDYGVDALPPHVTEALYQRRRAALRAAAGPDRPRRYAPVPLGGAVAATLAVVIGAVLWWSQPAPLPEGAGIDTFELLVAQEDLEFYENLEFYLWLADENPSG